MTTKLSPARLSRNFLRMIALGAALPGTWACAPDDQVPTAPIAVEIVETDAGYQLLRGGEPYVIKGAGMGGNDIENLAAHGGNSIRNWTTISEQVDTATLLDDAFANGVTVGLGLTMQAERWGFDYDDEDAIARQL